jgi:Lon protease-like protein
MTSMTVRWATMLVVLLWIPGATVAQGRPRESTPLPANIPLFPLPDVTLLPNSTQPFHIFEPRYRAMIGDALRGDSIIGMVTLQPGYESDYEGRPPVFPMGCAGIIVRSEQLPDGRYDIVIRGLTKFRVLGEDQSQPYRLAEVEEILEKVDPDELLSQRRHEVEEAILEVFPNARLPSAEIPDAQVIDGFSLQVPMQPMQRQTLLEADGPAERAEALVRIIRGVTQASR